MTIYRSPIVLGQEYINKRTGVEGHAIYVGFNENECVEVGIERVDTDSNGKIEVSTNTINELYLTRRIDTEQDGALLANTPSEPPQPQEYESDIVLGRQYRDIQTGLEGWAAVIDFHENMATRVTLRSVGYDKDDCKVLRYHSIDDFLLVDVETEQGVERKTDKRSPVTREITRP